MSADAIRMLALQRKLDLEMQMWESSDISPMEGPNDRGEDTKSAYEIVTTPSAVYDIVWKVLRIRDSQDMEQ